MKALVIALLITLAGCANNSRYIGEMNSLIGHADKAHFASQYGPPEKQATIDESTEVWEYRLNERRYVSYTGYNYSTCDMLRLTFRDGGLWEWRREPVVQ